MRLRVLLLAGLLGLTALPLQAACFADYKAKQDNPLRLAYGVIEVRGECSANAARGQVQQRLGAAGWQLLNIISVFGPEGLEERKTNAGAHFLRF